MDALQEIREKIERASDRRAELYHALSEGFDPETAAELRELEKEIEQLWEEHRSLRAAIRFGEREKILRRARTEERIERSAA
jgi:ABC-type phosphate transport system auxiliary subunit